MNKIVVESLIFEIGQTKAAIESAHYWASIRATVYKNRAIGKAEGHVESAYYWALRLGVVK